MGCNQASSSAAPARRRCGESAENAKQNAVQIISYMIVTINGYVTVRCFARQGLANVTLPSGNSSSLAGVASKGGDHDWEGDGDGGEEALLSFEDVKGVFGDVQDLMDGPFPVPDLDEFVGLGSAVAGDLGDGAYAQIVDSMESGWVFGNIITQGTLHFAPARDPAVG